MGGEVADRSLLPSLWGTELEDSLLTKAGGLVTSREGVVDVEYGETNLVPKICLEGSRARQNSLVSQASEDAGRWGGDAGIPVVVGGVVRTRRLFPGVAGDLAKALEDARRRIQLIVRHDHGTVHDGSRFIGPDATRVRSWETRRRRSWLSVVG